MESHQHRVANQTQNRNLTMCDRPETNDYSQQTNRSHAASIQKAMVDQLSYNVRYGRNLHDEDVQCSSPTHSDHSRGRFL